MHGENAAKHPGREYWSRRLPGAYSWGRIGKWITHRKERAASRRAEIAAKRLAEEEAAWSCQSCGTMVEDNHPGPHCRSCASYWQDVANGLFDRD
jgi:hypothetical protein